jgi:hypothetical protein
MSQDINYFAKYDLMSLDSLGQSITDLAPTAQTLTLGETLLAEPSTDPLHLPSMGILFSQGINLFTKY